MRTRIAVLWVTWTVLLGTLITIALQAGERASIFDMHSAWSLRTTGPHHFSVVAVLILLIELLVVLAVLFVLYLPPIVLTARWRRRS